MPGNHLAQCLKLNAEKEQSDLGHQVSTIGPHGDTPVVPNPKSEVCLPWKALEDGELGTHAGKLEWSRWVNGYFHGDLCMPSCVRSGPLWSLSSCGLSSSKIPGLSSLLVCTQVLLA